MRERTTVRDRVNTLINWYRKSKKAGQVTPKVIRVDATANTIRKFAYARHGVYKYRRYIIQPLRPVRTRHEISQARRTAEAKNHDFFNP